MEPTEEDLEMELLVDRTVGLAKPKGGLVEAGLLDLDTAGAPVYNHVAMLRMFFLFLILQYIAYTFIVYLLFSTGALKAIPSWIVDELHGSSADSGHWIAERDVLLILLLVLVCTFLFIYTLTFAFKTHPILRWLFLSFFIIGKIISLAIIGILMDDIAPVQICMNLAIISMALLGYSLSPHGEDPNTWGALIIVAIGTVVTWVLGVYAFLVQRHLVVVFAVPLSTFFISQGMVYMSGLSESDRYGPNEKPRFFLDYHLLIVNLIMEPQSRPSKR